MRQMMVQGRYEVEFELHSKIVNFLDYPVIYNTFFNGYFDVHEIYEIISVIN